MSDGKFSSQGPRVILLLIVFLVLVWAVVALSAPASVLSTIQRFGRTTKRWQSQRRTIWRTHVPVRARAASILRP